MREKITKNHSSSGDTLPDKLVVLNISRPKSKTFYWGILLLISLVTISELIARTDWAQERIPFQAYGTNNIQFEFQVRNFNAFMEDHDTLDCVILGTSMSFRGINPEVVDAAYLAARGENINCYNFSVIGLHLRDAVLLRDMLAKIYHPKLFIVGISFLDFSESRENSLGSRFYENDWLLHQLGEVSLKGWLVNNSYAFRAMLLLSYTVPYQLNYEGKNGIGFFIDKWERQISSYGFGMTSTILEDIGSPMTPNQISRFLEQFGEFNSSTTNLAAMDDLLSHNNRDGVETIILEMPYHENLVRIIDENGNQLPEQELLDNLIADVHKELTHIAESYGVQYWRTGVLESIPEDGWRDRYHLNHIGSEIFSIWLGETLGNAVDSGLIEDFLAGN